jgi:hypothetical protein
MQKLHSMGNCRQINLRGEEFPRLKSTPRKIVLAGAGGAAPDEIA